jgi:hypothetical protein
MPVLLACGPTLVSFIARVATYTHTWGSLAAQRRSTNQHTQQQQPRCVTAAVRVLSVVHPSGSVGSHVSAMVTVAGPAQCSHASCSIQGWPVPGRLLLRPAAHQQEVAQRACGVSTHSL